MDLRYYEWAHSYYGSVPSVGVLLCALPSLPVQARKCILGFTRIRQPVSTGSRFRESFRDELSMTATFRDSTTSSPVHITVHDLLVNLEPFMLDPITMAFISTVTRSAPYEDYSSVIETKRITIEKELAAAISVSKNAELDYEPIFSPDPSARYKRLFPNLPLHPEVHVSLFRGFVLARKFLEGRLLYPVMSSKSIGQQAQEIANWSIPHAGPCTSSMEFVTSTQDLERIYHETGLKTSGVVEVRSAWKYNDLKPRVYYAQGPDCYYASRYIQAVFNVILDCFEIVHRYNRYEAIPERMDYPDRLVTYDYSSFTSCLEEVKRFTRQLANFMSGTKVVLVDTHEGCVAKDLGELLHEYTDRCNEWADFDVARVLDLREAFIHRHTTGMLGVPGNISSCTLLHGVHLAVVIGSLGRARCVGDDALAIIPEGRKHNQWDQFVDRVQNLGRISEDKFKHWDWESDPDSEGWHYLKRPIARLAGATIQGESLVWPTIHNLIPLTDKYHTVPSATPLENTKKFISQWARLLTKIEVLCIELSDTDRMLLEIFQDRTYRTLGLRKGGSVFIKSLGKSLLAPRRLDKHEFGTGWKQITIEYMKKWDVEVTVPEWGYDATFLGCQGEIFCSKSTRVLGLLEKLGYVTRQLVKTSYKMRDVSSPNLLNCLITLSYDFLYSYTVLHDFPLWANTVSILEHMSPHERLALVPQG
jgi:hypothetical protein